MGAPVPPVCRRYYGLHLPLLAGTEVAIGFEDGNPDRPYIAGVLRLGARRSRHHPQLQRNVLRTPANNKIRLDDERGKEHVKVSTEYGGKSQLNLGHRSTAKSRSVGRVSSSEPTAGAPSGHRKDVYQR